ncbi:hypothetical protein BC01_010 [Bacillus phage BC01]|nr:hypothetical protein PBC6_009 [Bacillus phage PBC6]AXU41107.1 hypothetical protein BC01_010 [Bacillus phage BC01]
MFGLSEKDFDEYRDLAQDFAVEELTPNILSGAKLITPLVEKDGKLLPIPSHINKMLSDLETIITLTTVNMACDYADLVTKLELTEADIIKHLHEKYEIYVTNQFIKYCLCFTTEASDLIVGEIILELPYLYVDAISDEDFDGDKYLEDKLKAYNDYLDNNPVFSEEDEEE